MRYAHTIQDVLHSMMSEPLKSEDLEEFYVETMPVRTGETVISPTETLMESCQFPSEQNSFLFLGHRGCGKSTELNRLAQALEKDGFPVFTVPCGKELDLINMAYQDLLILMGDALLSIMEKKGFTMEDAFTDEIQRFWRVETEKEQTQAKDYGLDASFGFAASSGIPGMLKSLLKIKGSLKYGDSVKVVYREKIEQNASEWLMLLRKLIDQITVFCEGKQPVLIFEDLDKLDTESAWRVFSGHAFKLSGLPCPVIFTFPIALSYAARFGELSSTFRVETLPMIKIMTPKGERYDDGYQEIREIIKRRMDADALFEEGVLDYLITKTGGALRDLFHAINECARYANRSRADIISMKFAKLALGRIKSDLTRRIERRNYDFLAEIYKGNREMIEDKKMLLEMLQAGVVLEYNGTRWHNVHPLIGEFLEEQGIV